MLSGAVRCETCAAKIIAIAPLVPIVPNLLAEAMPIVTQLLAQDETADYLLTSHIA